MKKNKFTAYLTLFGFALSLTGTGRTTTAWQGRLPSGSLRTDTLLSGTVSPDHVFPDTAFSDTLREVTILSDSLRLAPVRSAISQSLGRNTEPHVKSLGEILNDFAPNAMDYVLHPFGFAERKKAKKRKKAMKILEDIDRATAPSAYFHALDSILKGEREK